MVPSKDKHAGAGGRTKKHPKDRKAGRSAQRRRAGQAEHGGDDNESRKHEHSARRKKPKKGKGSGKEKDARKKDKRDKEKKSGRDGKRGKEKSTKGKRRNRDAKSDSDNQQTVRPTPNEGVGARSVQPAATNAATGSARDRRQRMIAEAAYFIAERRGFSGGDPEQDWLEAEREVARRLRGESGQ